MSKEIKVGNRVKLNSHPNKTFRVIKLADESEQLLLGFANNYTQKEYYLVEEEPPIDSYFANNRSSRAGGYSSDDTIKPHLTKLWCGQDDLSLV